MLTPQAVNKLTGGVEFLLKKNKVDYIKGFGKLKSGHEVSKLNTAYSSFTLS